MDYMGLLADTGVIKKKKFPTSLLDEYEAPEAEAPPADAVKGLLNYSPEEMAARKQQAFFGAMLKASGPSALPVGFGQVLGAGLEAGSKAEDDYRNDAAKNEYLTGKLAGAGSKAPAALQLAQAEAEALARGDMEAVARIRAYAKTADVQNEYSKGMIKDANGNFVAAPGYANASGAIKNAEAAGTETGKETATRTMNAPTQIAALDTKIKIVNDALSHPGFDSNFGMAGVLPNRPGGEAADAKAFIDQIRGGAFLTAIGEMKGSGAISEKEGAAATEAVGRFNSAQSPEAARRAMKDLITVMEGARSRQTQYTAQPTAPKPRLKYNPATGDFE